MVRDAGSRARILNVNIVDDQVNLIVATKIVITIKIRLIVQPYSRGLAVDLYSRPTGGEFNQGFLASLTGSFAALFRGGDDTAGL